MSKNKQKKHPLQLRIIWLLPLVLVSLIGNQIASAQTVRPMIYELETLGAKSSESLRIENPRQYPITVEVLANKLSMDELGNETETPADDDFLIYPPQAIIDPGNTQIIRVKYVGDPTIEKSQAYRITVAQLPVDLSGQESSGVGVVFKFKTLANVVPQDAVPNLAITEIIAAQDEETNEDRWLVTIDNSGSRFVRLSQTEWEVSSRDNSSPKQTIDKVRVGQMVDTNLVMPESTLKVSIPPIEGFELGNVDITIDQS